LVIRAWSLGFVSDFVLRISRFLPQVRRWFSRSEWLIRLLRLTKTSGLTGEPGLVLIQIDGLSRHQFEHAIAQGHLPFLSRLRQEQGYDLHSLYSGLPSVTPAMTAELLYGVKCAVPAFSFYDRPAGTIVRMFDPRPARLVEERLYAEGAPLLGGGSVYAGIFTGGATEAHFCASTLGLDELFRRRYPWRLLLVFLFSGYSLLRVGVLLAIELILALVDCARGLIAGQDLWREVKFIPSRVGVTIVMREFATIGAKIDVTRGLPVIYLDLVGYDEQAHRRGPSSRFAHWTLKGIDRAIARIWKTARRSVRRSYEVWVFSDHGSAEMVPYLRRTGRTLEEAVTEIFGERVQTFVEDSDAAALRIGRTRSFLAGRSGIRPRVRREVETPADLSMHVAEPVLAARGPIGHIYVDYPLDPLERDRLAQALVERGQVPLVAVLKDQDHVFLWCKEGRFLLPDEATLVFPQDHPFLVELVHDFITVCRHPDAGNFVLWGWSRTAMSCAFSVETGSHGGPGLEETHGFALLPGAAPIRFGAKGYLRPLDLRQAALRHLGRAVSLRPLVPAVPSAAP
jgi:hypothetical protein